MATIGIPNREPRVCVLTTVHSAFDVRIFHKECCTLARAGWGVVLVAPHPRDEERAAVRIRAVPKRRSRLGRFTRTAWDVYRLALREDADVYHFHDPDLLPIGLLLRARGRTVVYDAHEDLPRDISHKDWLPSATRVPLARIVEAMEMRVAHSMSAIVTANEEVRVRLATANPRTVVLRNYPRLDEFRSVSAATDSPRDRGLLVSMGGIMAGRCAQQLVAAMESVSQEPGCRLSLGGGVESTDLLRLVESMPGWDHVDYVGVVQRDDMIRLLHTAAISLVLYSPEPNHYHPSSNRLFESMAAGAPLIVSDFPEWRTLVADGGCGLTVDPTDPKDIARGIDHLLKRPEKAAQMGQRGRELAFSEFNWETQEETLLQLYERLLVDVGDDRAPAVAGARRKAS